MADPASAFDLTSEGNFSNDEIRQCTKDQPQLHHFNPQLPSLPPSPQLPSLLPSPQLHVQKQAHKNWLDRDGTNRLYDDDELAQAFREYVHSPTNTSRCEQEESRGGDVYPTPPESSCVSSNTHAMGRDTRDSSAIRTASSFMNSYPSPESPEANLDEAVASSPTDNESNIASTTANDHSNKTECKKRRCRQRPEKSKSGRRKKVKTTKSSCVDPQKMAYSFGLENMAALPNTETRRRPDFRNGITLSACENNPDKNDASGLGIALTMCLAETNRDELRDNLGQISSVINNTNLCSLYTTAIELVQQAFRAEHEERTPFMQWSGEFLRQKGIAPTKAAITAKAADKVMNRLVDLQRWLIRNSHVKPLDDPKEVRTNIHSRIAQGRLWLAFKERLGIHVLLLAPDSLLKLNKSLPDSEREEIIRHLVARKDDEEDDFAKDLECAENSLSQLYSEQVISSETPDEQLLSFGLAWINPV
ncbi:hypothetical protein LTS08_008873 [Lithohypha guttulata]|nr:hypothetical protein LTS08_008873 [Lithohypha guttulata]